MSKVDTFIAETIRICEQQSGQRDAAFFGRKIYGLAQAARDEREEEVDIAFDIAKVSSEHLGKAIADTIRAEMRNTLPRETAREVGESIRREIRRSSFKLDPVELPTLPTWEECEEANDEGTATPLQLFILHNEPGGSSAEAQFRRQLLDIIRDLTK